jgi:hypothetical protein
MNDKMGGDLAKIKDVGRYFVEVHISELLFLLRTNLEKRVISPL